MEQVRDWHKDKLDNLIKRCELAKGYGETICVDPDAVISLIEREKKLREAIENARNRMGERTWTAVEQLFKTYDSLYPDKEEEAK